MMLAALLTSALAWGAPAPLVAQAVASAPQATLESECAVAREALVGRLLVLADWCQANELYASRDQTWRGVLALESENAVARQGLRFARGPDGAWKEPAPREVKDRNPAAAPSLASKRSECVRPYRDAVLQALERFEADKATRDAQYTAILSLDPEDALLRELRGEAKLDGQWVLRETLQAKERRAQIRDAAAAAQSAVQRYPEFAPQAIEIATGLSWRFCIGEPSVRVLATTSADEARRVFQLASATRPFLDSVLSEPYPAPPDGTATWSIYLLSTPEEGNQFLDSMPGVPTEFKAFVQQHVIGTALPATSQIAYWDKDSKKRVDGAVRQVVQAELAQRFGITRAQGWAYEGFGLYLTRELVGTRLTWFIQMSTDGNFNRQREALLRSDTNWMNETKKLLERAQHPRMRDLAQNDVNRMGIEDVLYAYTFAAYMLEGRPQDVPNLLRRVGKHLEPMAEVIQSVTGLGMDEFELHLGRWLSERR